MTSNTQKWLAKLEAITTSYLNFLLKNEDQALEEIQLFLNNRQSLLNIIDREEKKITNLDKTNKIDERTGVLSRIVAMDEQIVRILTRARKDSEERLSRLSAGQRALRGYRNRSDQTRG
jgi:hypothetical protein